MLLVLIINDDEQCARNNVTTFKLLKILKSTPLQSVAVLKLETEWSFEKKVLTITDG